LAKEYSKLPSEILAKADTFDMLVYDVSTTYQQYVRKKANKEAPNMSSMDTTGLNDLSEKYYGKSIS
jgi:hypothetical protein